MNNIKKYLDNVKYEYKDLLLQPLIEDFTKKWEIKTYWLNGKYLYSFGHKKTKNGYSITKPKSKGGKMDDKIINNCLKIGRELIKDLFNDKEPLIQCRIDFGCCIVDKEKDKDKDKYFINEIEVCPALSLDDTNDPYFHKIAEEVVKFCL